MPLVRILIAIFALLGPLSARTLGADPSLEYKVKAVFVLNAARFVTWPAGVFPTADSPVVIGILGENPFGPLLAEAVAGETVKGRQIVVRRVSMGDACHILFVSRSEQGHLPRVLESAAQSRALTISEIEGFARNGGMIGLVVQNENVRFEVNPAAVSRANINLDARLLRLAKLVK
jgi:hypothetical protein